MASVLSMRIAVAFLIGLPSIGVLLLLKGCQVFVDLLRQRLLGELPPLHIIIHDHSVLLSAVAIVVGSTSIVLLFALREQRWSLVAGIITAAVMTILQYVAGIILFFLMVCIGEQSLIH